MARDIYFWLSGDFSFPMLRDIVYEAAKCDHHVVGCGELIVGPFLHEHTPSYHMGNAQNIVAIFETETGSSEELFDEQRGMEARATTVFTLNDRERDVEWLFDCLVCVATLLQRFQGDAFFVVMGAPVLLRQDHEIVLNEWAQEFLAKRVLYDELAQDFIQKLRERLTGTSRKFKEVEFRRSV